MIEAMKMKDPSMIGIKEKQERTSATLAIELHNHQTKTQYGTFTLSLKEMIQIGRDCEVKN